VAVDWLRDTQWLLWLAAALTAALIEIVSLDFFFIMVAGGALTAAIAAALGAPVPLQVIIFAVSSGGLLMVGRPRLKRWAQRTPSVTMNAAALVGREARVLETVTDRAGQVKLHGEVWTARAAPGFAQLEVGSDVLVVRIDGATAVVAPEPAPPAHHSLEGNPTP
jgi:membrane protein implicated in regulation of membrane protease activity